MTEEQPGTGPTLSLHERLAVVYSRLDELPPAAGPEAALAQLSTTLEQVEDEFSGVPKNPNPGLKFDGRMYPPRDDFIERTAEGGLVATTKGNRIEIDASGSMKIYSRRTEEVVYERPGAGSDAVTHGRDARERLAQLRDRLHTSQPVEVQASMPTHAADPSREQLEHPDPTPEAGQEIGPA